jgi:hypothetical protein
METDRIINNTSGKIKGRMIFNTNGYDIETLTDEDKAIALLG